VPGSASPAAPRLAEVNQATLIGRPVSAVSRQLRQLGLRVQVIWRHNGHQQPGTVISVQPTGRRPAGTTVTVTGALAPPGHSSGGNDQGNSGQGD
jgi:beta-lactam-binding protein with PASTA domain